MQDNLFWKIYGKMIFEQDLSKSSSQVYVMKRKIDSLAVSISHNHTINGHNIESHVEPL